MSFSSFWLMGEAMPFGGASCFWSFPQTQKLGNAPLNRAIVLVLTCFYRLLITLSCIIPLCLPGDVEPFLWWTESLYSANLSESNHLLYWSCTLTLQAYTMQHTRLSQPRTTCLIFTTKHYHTLAWSSQSSTTWSISHTQHMRGTCPFIGLTNRYTNKSTTHR